MWASVVNQLNVPLKNEKISSHPHADAHVKTLPFALQSQLARQLGELQGTDGAPPLPSPSSPPPPAPPVRQHQAKFQRSFIDGDFDFVSPNSSSTLLTNSNKVIPVNSLHDKCSPF